MQKRIHNPLTTHRYTIMKPTLVSLQAEIVALRSELEIMKTEIGVLRAQPQAPRTPGKGVRDYGPASTRKMDDEIAWRIMFGDLKAMSVKDISNTYGLSRGQVYSVRGYYTFTHLKADEMPESLVEKYEAAEAVAQ